MFTMLQSDYNTCFKILLLLHVFMPDKENLEIFVIMTKLLK